VYFDLHETDYAVKTAWIDSGDGFLVVDLNENGEIDDITELFGDSETDGFTALSSMDSNADGVINVSDSGFASLKVWIDADSDGETDSGELYTLNSLGITEIALSGTYTKTDATTGLVAEGAANDNGCCERAVA